MTPSKRDAAKLREKYERVREEEPEISRTAMAKRLGVHPSTLAKRVAEWNAPPADLTGVFDPVPHQAPVSPPEPEPPAPEPRKSAIYALELDPEKVYHAAKEAIAPKEKRKPRPPREKRFSEAHPGAWNLARNLLPRLQVLVPMFVLCYLALTETMKGNYAFYDDWAKALHIPGIMNVLSHLDLLQPTLMANGGYYLMVLIAVVLGVVLFYEFIWKSAFKEYRKKVYMREYKEGRCYWNDGNCLCHLFDRIYRSPPRERFRFYIRTHWWPLLNIFNPRASMLEITVSKDERFCTRGNKLIVEEKPIRRLTDHNRMVTCDDGYVGVDVPNKEARAELESRTSELIKGTQKVTLANPYISKRILDKSGIVASPEFVEEVRKAKEEKAGGA